MELTDLILVIVLGLAGYRITRFLLFDILIEGIRNKWYALLVNHPKPAIITNKLLDLTTCSWCLGFWVNLAIYSAFIHTSPHQFGIFEFVTLFAITGVQGLLHALEPGEDDHEH